MKYQVTYTASRVSEKNRKMKENSHKCKSFKKTTSGHVSKKREITEEAKTS